MELAAPRKYRSPWLSPSPALLVVLALAGTFRHWWNKYGYQLVSVPVLLLNTGLWGCPPTLLYFYWLVLILLVHSASAIPILTGCTDKLTYMIPTRLVVLGISVLAQINAVFVGGIDAVVMSASPLVVFLLHFY